MSEWQLLARGDPGVSVLRCPEGHIHVEVASGTITLLFKEEEFLIFAHTIMQGLGAVSTKGLLRPFQMQPPERFSRN